MSLNKNPPWSDAAVVVALASASCKSARLLARPLVRSLAVSSAAKNTVSVSASRVYQPTRTASRDCTDDDEEKHHSSVQRPSGE